VLLPPSLLLLPPLLLAPAPSLLLLLLLLAPAPSLMLSTALPRHCTTARQHLPVSWTAEYHLQSDSASTEEDSASIPVLQHVSSRASHCTNMSVSGTMSVKLFSGTMSVLFSGTMSVLFSGTMLVLFSGTMLVLFSGTMSVLFSGTMLVKLFSGTMSVLFSGTMSVKLSAAARCSKYPSMLP
jgi:hypothetical protein